MQTNTGRSGREESRGGTNAGSAGVNMEIVQGETFGTNGLSRWTNGLIKEHFFPLQLRRLTPLSNTDPVWPQMELKWPGAMPSNQALQLGKTTLVKPRPLLTYPDFSILIDIFNYPQFCGGKVVTKTAHYPSSGWSAVLFLVVFHLS